VEFFDAHAHIAVPEFAEDLPEVLARAEAAGVRGIVAVGETLEDAERTLALADRYPCSSRLPAFIPRTWIWRRPRPSWRSSGGMPTGWSPSARWGWITGR